MATATATATATTTTTTTTTLTATMTTVTTMTTAAAATTVMAAASATAIAGPHTTINLSYRNGYVKLDTTKMFCREDYKEAATTSEPCPEEDCPEGQTYWADVKLYGSGAEEEGEESDED
jgi:hypothetical protein